jgi:hypothetical protein
LQYEQKYFHGNTDDGFDNITEEKFQRGYGAEYIPTSIHPVTTEGRRRTTNINSGMDI